MAIYSYNILVESKQIEVIKRQFTSITVATGFGAVGVPVTTLCNEVAESGSASAAQICETSAFAIIQLCYTLLSILLSEHIPQKSDSEVPYAPPFLLLPESVRPA